MNLTCTAALAAIIGKQFFRLSREFTFLATIPIIGASTCIVGISPDYATIGITAPIILIVRRIHFVNS